MSAPSNSVRLDTLFALALTLGQRGRGEDARTRAEDDDGGEGFARESLDARDAAETAFGNRPGSPSPETTDASPTGAWKIFSSLGASERLALERRAAWHARLPPAKQREWLAYTLGIARERGAAQLDEHVHPSHVVEVLRDEPAYVRRLVAAHLPPALAAHVEEVFGAGGATSVSPEPESELVGVVRRTFLSHFTSRAELARVTPLELLTGVELARLVRLLGVRETALACRAIQAVEAVGSFLRRFAPEDAHAVAAHISTLTDVDPRRVAFAERVVHEAFSAEPEPSAMLNRAGLRLLALTLATRDEAHLNYVAQKLPLEAARWLRRMTEAARRGGYSTSELTIEGASGRDLLRVVAREAEELAAGVKRPPRARARPKPVADGEAQT
ncbi:MAG TPA: hypothetical protein VER08_09220 [Pyrinomonadaceae bacterium]|nr:hypothetical protein [Pyrinomonadaceae bacterium]